LQTPRQQYGASAIGQQQTSAFGYTNNDAQTSATREIQMKTLKSAIKIKNTARLSCKLTIMILMV
jgi:hypothetical protein